MEVLGNFLGDSSDRTGLDGFLLGRLSCLIIGPIGFLASAQRCRKPHSKVLWGKEHTSCNSQPPTVLLQKWVAEGKLVFSTLSLLLLWRADARHWRWILDDGHRRESELYQLLFPTEQQVDVMIHLQGSAMYREEECRPAVKLCHTLHETLSSRLFCFHRFQVKPRWELTHFFFSRTTKITFWKCYTGCIWSSFEME